MMSSSNQGSALSDFINALSPPDVSHRIREVLSRYTRPIPASHDQDEFNRALSGFTAEAYRHTPPIIKPLHDDESLGEAIRLLERYYQNGGYEGAYAIFHTNPTAGINKALTTIAKATLSEFNNRHTQTVLLKFAGTFPKRKEIVEEILKRYGSQLPTHLLNVPVWVLAEDFFELTNLILRIESKINPKSLIPTLKNQSHPHRESNPNPAA